MQQSGGRIGRRFQSFGDYLFYDVKPSGPVVGCLRMGRQEPGKWTIDFLQCKDTIGKQVHRRL
jgi:hypothetical protein